MEILFQKPESLKEQSTTYCPGCGHGVAHRLVAEIIDEMGLREKTIGVAPVGCAVFAYDYWNFDVTEAAHGRTPCVAAGIKRVLPDRTVFSYQGDGDLASIGMGEIIHTANRGENITVIFINNANYGMTGGQMAPTTLLGQKTLTTLEGRKIQEGHPIRIPELLSSLPGAVYLDRQSLHDPAHIVKAKKSLRQAFEVQQAGKGFALVELLSACPSNWGMAPVASMNWIKEQMIPVFPLGLVKDTSDLFKK